MTLDAEIHSSLVGSQNFIMKSNLKNVVLSLNSPHSSLAASEAGYSYGTIFLH
jgi:hypothetical protein